MDKTETGGKTGTARVTLALPGDVVAALDAQVAAGAARNRSALAAELLRCAQQHRAGREGNAKAAGSVSAVYDGRVRGAAEGVLAAEERAREVAVASVAEMPLGEGRRLRVALVRGRSGAVRAFARRLEAVRGVRRVQVALTEVGGE